MAVFFPESQDLQALRAMEILMDHSFNYVVCLYMYVYTRTQNLLSVQIMYSYILTNVRPKILSG